jgi:hypothetical protein
MAAAVKLLLLMFLAAPGSFALILLVLRSVVRAARRERQEDEDHARKIRIASEYGLMEDAIERRVVMPPPEPETGTIVPNPGKRDPEAPTSRYRDEVARG